MEILKSAVLLVNEHQNDQKKMIQMIFEINFRYVFDQAITTLSMKCQKMEHQGGF